MSLTKAEALAVNDLLTWIVSGTTRQYEPREAAGLLADHAYAALGRGIRAADLAPVSRWPAEPPGPLTTRLDMVLALLGHAAADWDETAGEHKDPALAAAYREVAETARVIRGGPGMSGQETGSLRERLRAVLEDPDIDELEDAVDALTAFTNVRDELTGAEAERDRLREEAREARRQIAMVKRLHFQYRGPTDPDSCAECNRLAGYEIRWPCPTIAALDQPEPEQRNATEGNGT